MSEPRWTSPRIATAIHDEAIYEVGGLAGIREHGLLESALDRPRHRLAYEPGSSIFEPAAALCFGVASNHPFNDGNKRTALLSARAANSYPMDGQLTERKGPIGRHTERLRGLLVEIGWP